MEYDASINSHPDMEFTGGIYVITYMAAALIFLAGFLVHLILF